jgi:hypothetical protein
MIAVSWREKIASVHEWSARATKVARDESHQENREKTAISMNASTATGAERTA